MTAPALDQLPALIARIAQTLQHGDDAARARAAADVEQLRGLLASAGAPAVNAGFDLAQVGDALRVFAEWLGAPTPAKEAEARAAMTELEATVGPLVGWNPAREEAAQREQYRREARAALDDHFRTKPKPS